MMTFNQYVEMRANEGLWLNDKLAVPGLSKIILPSPPKKTKPPAAPRIKPVHAPAPPKPVGEVQLPDALTMMGRMGISLIEPSRDQMKRLVDKAKNRVMVPQESPPPFPARGAAPPTRSACRQSPNRPRAIRSPMAPRTGTG